MIANPKWFSPRKFTGWGLTPNCWQGWAYIGLVILPIVLIPSLNLTGLLPSALMIAWGLFFAVDFVDVALHLKRDERDILHEALAERNAMWFVLMALVVGLAYRTAQGVATGNVQIDPVILIPLLGAVAVKAITHWYLRDK